MTPKQPTKKTVSAPRGMSSGAKQLFNDVANRYDLESHHIRLLVLACEQITRADQAREALKDGQLTAPDRFGQSKIRPEVEIERNASLAACRLLRELGLDVEAVEVTKRGYSRRGT